MKIDPFLLEDMSEFLGIKKEEIRRRYKFVEKNFEGFVKWCKVTEEEWKKRGINQTSPEEVANFYRTTPNYIWELVEYHSTDFKRDLSKKVIEISKKRGVRSILDYGAGIGQDSILQNQEGFETSLADLPGKTLDFARYRIEKRKLPIEVIEIDPLKMPLKKSYDSITCFEVMQHLTNPQETISHFQEHLKYSGFLFLTYRFEDNYSLALDHNKAYKDKFSEIIESQGLSLEEKIPFHRLEDGRIKILEVYKK